MPDAAHGTSPLGAQSTNVGLTEAHDLVERAAVAALEDYDAASTRAWQTLLGFNVSRELLPHAAPWRGALVREMVQALPASGRDLESQLEQIGIAFR